MLHNNGGNLRLALLSLDGWIFTYRWKRIFLDAPEGACEEVQC
jgi:hypothetical protein